MGMTKLELLDGVVKIATETNGVRSIGEVRSGVLVLNKKLGFKNHGLIREVLNGSVAVEQTITHNQPS